MKKTVIAIFILLIVVGLTACSDSGPEELHLYTWSEYIDPEIYTLFEDCSVGLHGGYHE